MAWTVGLGPGAFDNEERVVVASPFSLHRYENWNGGTGDNSEDKDCVYIDGSTNTWFFGDCLASKPYVCEQTNACPAEAYPCYHQPDQKLDWCEPLMLTDSQCQHAGIMPMMPFVSMSYVYYLHGIVSGPDAPLALALVFPSPCYGSPLTYHTVVHQYSKLVLGLGTGIAFGKGGMRGPGISPVGARAEAKGRGVDARVEAPPQVS